MRWWRGWRWDLATLLVVTLVVGSCIRGENAQAWGDDALGAPLPTEAAPRMARMWDGPPTVPARVFSHGPYLIVTTWCHSDERGERGWQGLIGWVAQTPHEAGMVLAAWLGVLSPEDFKKKMGELPYAAPSGIEEYTEKCHGDGTLSA